jgi:hydantoinase/carbamoylase family amidase
MSAARRVLERADELAGFSEEPGRITRRLGTPALEAAMERVREWMEAAGLQTRRDALGNLAGRRGSDPVLIGSHLDTVGDAGRYDGVLGVLVGIEVAHALPEAPIEVVAFADEEGLRFRSTFLGSRAFLGRLEERELEVSDAAGVTLGEAIGGSLGPPLYDGGRAYLEVHIEQGPVLETAGVPLGVVTAIAGQTRCALEFEGRAAHAGTTPMDLRHDALAAAAEFVLAAEREARAEPGLVATVGEIGVARGAVNVVPGCVEATLDVRHQDDAARERALSALRTDVNAICTRRGVSAHWTTIADVPATPCTPALVQRLCTALGETGRDARRLPSGAGHDAMTMAAVTDVAMLFVRCEGGISHHPDEAVTEGDVAAAIDVATRFARHVADGA